MRISRLDRYIFNMTLFGILVAAGGVCLSIILVDIVEQLRNVSGVANANTFTALRFTLMRTPGILELALPFAVLVGSIVTFMRLARSSEIVAMRASGVSTWRFLSPVAVLATLVGLFAIFILGPSAARLNIAYETQLQALSAVATTRTGEGGRTMMWIKDRGPDLQLTVSAEAGSAGDYSNVTLLAFSKTDSRFIARYDAKTARRTGTSWTLSNGVKASVGTQPSPFETLTFPILKDRIDDSQRNKDATARAMSIWDLPRAARDAEAAGGSPQRYWFQFHRKLALPIALLSMAMIAAVLSLSGDRFGRRAIMAAAAIAAGLVVYFVNDISGALATAGYAPGWIAAWCPPLAALFIALATVSYREDG
jgi:lipopolysaccharide export system permease protein